jgi:hypothetical protein
MPDCTLEVPLLIVIEVHTNYISIYAREAQHHGIITRIQIFRWKWCCEVFPSLYSNFLVGSNVGYVSNHYSTVWESGDLKSGRWESIFE